MFSIAIKGLFFSSNFSLNFIARVCEKKSLPTLQIKCLIFLLYNVSASANFHSLRRWFWWSYSPFHDVHIERWSWVVKGSMRREFWITLWGDQGCANEVPWTRQEMFWTRSALVHTLNKATWREEGVLNEAQVHKEVSKCWRHGARSRTLVQGQIKLSCSIFGRKLSICSRIIPLI